MASSAALDESTARRPSSRFAEITSPSLGFLAIAVQFALVLAVVERFALESDAVRSVLRLAFAGFFIHHFLPSRFRQPFFLALSLAGIAWVLGSEPGGWNAVAGLGRMAVIVVVGCGLVGLCHLPLPYAGRVALLLGAGAGLAFLRSGAGPDIGAYAAIWPILGAMFMFRLIVYLYDLENMKEKPGLTTSLSYFFLLPNVCFPLFPVIDFKTFCRNHFKQDAILLYDTGLRWMLRGAIHLVLWRLVYYNLFIDPSKVTTGADLYQFLVTNMALYLRVSGQFHLIIGLLHMFGYGLPETNRFYFLSSSFTDYWRRVNIYWKDFILKIFYNPTVFRFKHLGEKQSVILATVVAFFMTWLLHSYQWFWLRGDFPIAENDIVFWGALGVLVVGNSVRELSHGRQRTLGTREVGLSEELGVGLRTALTFSALTILWSIWNSQSMRHVFELWKLADLDTLWMSALTLLGIAVARIALDRSEARRPKPKTRLKKEEARPYDLAAAMRAVVLPVLILAILSVRTFQGMIGGDLEVVLKSLSSTAPNEADEEQMQAGYYEDLMDVRRFNSLLSESYMSQPADWKLLEQTDAIQWIDDVRFKDLRPSSEHVVNGHSIRINALGMRDDEYALEKPPGSYRIALLGSSLVMGWGVDQGQPFESLLEARLNREGGPWQRLEIWNFAVNGYTSLSQASLMKARVPAAHPDALYLVAHIEDAFFIKQQFAKAIRRGVKLPDWLAEIARKANVDANTPPAWAAHRLEPFWAEMTERSLATIAERGRAEGMELVWIYLPGVTEQADKAAERKQFLMDMASKAGFRIVDLTGLYGDHDREKLSVAPWDSHPNEEAHKLIAEMLYERLKAADELGIWSRTPTP